jgi:hypothetical protein
MNVEFRIGDLQMDETCLTPAALAPFMKEYPLKPPTPARKRYSSECPCGILASMCTYHKD